MTRDFLSDFLEERGITPGGEVADERGYAPYAAGDVDAVYEAMERLMPGLMENKGGRRNPGWVEKFTRSEGFVIPKYRVFEHLPPIRPQLRPRLEVDEGDWWHTHVPGEAVDSKGHVMSKHALEQHVTSGNRAEEHADVKRRHKRHRHVQTAKYGIAPDELRNPYAPRKEPHLVDIMGWFDFDDSKRLDHNPISGADFALPGPVFLGIEGTPKSDAMVEWLREHGRPAKVVNVPSVSTWKAPELALFALRHMRGHPVVIVPDADWAEKDEVIYHAENCALYLQRRCGVDAVIAAPPAHAELKGVDDFLGSEGSLDDLDVIRRDFDADALDEFEREFPSARRGYAKTAPFDLSVAHLLGRTSGSKGLTLRNVGALAPLARQGGVVTEEEALLMSGPPEVPGDDDFTEAEKQATYEALERLAGVAFEYTGQFPEWAGPRWETVGRKKDGTPRRVLKEGGPGSRIEFLRVDERLRMRALDPVPLGEHLKPRF